MRYLLKFQKCRLSPTHAFIILKTENLKCSLSRFLQFRFRTTFSETCPVVTDGGPESVPSSQVSVPHPQQHLQCSRCHGLVLAPALSILCHAQHPTPFLLPLLEPSTMHALPDGSMGLLAFPCHLLPLCFLQPPAPLMPQKQKLRRPRLSKVPLLT